MYSDRCRSSYIGIYYCSNGMYVCRGIVSRMRLWVWYGYSICKSILFYGDVLELFRVTFGTVVSQIECYVGKGSQYVRSGGLGGPCDLLDIVIEGGGLGFFFIS